MENKEVICDSQHGFTKGKQCLANLVAFYNRASAMVNKGKAITVICLDLCKEFDTVPQGIFVNCEDTDLTDGAISGLRIGWMVELKRVVVNGLESKHTQVMSGVPQGLVLGLVLFKIFLCNRDSEIGCTLSKFEQHQAVWYTQHSGGKEYHSELGTWACANFMRFNKGKCKTLQMGQGNPKHKYRLDGEFIDGSPVEKDQNVGWGEARYDLLICILDCSRRVVASRLREVILPWGP
ncbi:hypothetical protein WISP_14201 [Willisornis vidua]|uniref:Reverse transcriptase domain-containing protein n=1 Tax=Willisornis vidua TaxID=1566151 RepID=A0ABQ9DW44_9PASS|nr:hypothetical protein WISP_14201 [Willisornis vidua]